MTKLRRERIDRDWTLDFVAQRLGITIQAISAIELGKINPSYVVLIKLENLFGKTHRELLEPVEGNQDQNASNASAH